MILSFKIFIQLFLKKKIIRQTNRHFIFVDALPVCTNLTKLQNEMAEFPNLGEHCSLDGCKQIGR